MKRKSETTKHTLDGQIYKHYGLFAWQECLFCKKEFRRERAAIDFLHFRVSGLTVVNRVVVQNHIATII